MKKRILSLLMALVLLVTAILPMLPTAEAAKTTKTRAIAIVFDNSSSMYEDLQDEKGALLPVGQRENYRWNRATYAMEVFASMLNEGDTLYVFPMNPIVVDGVTYRDKKPLVINGPKEADKIHRINSPLPNMTPVEPLGYANEMLQSVSADEKYLIVLTDGQEFYEGPGYQKIIKYTENSTDAEYFKNKLGDYSEGVQFIFVAIDPAKGLPEVKYPDRQTHVAADSTELLPVLTNLCNQVFGRSEMEVQDDQIHVDVTLSKLFVFVQGDNIADVHIEGCDVSTVRQMQYVQKGSDQYPNHVDTSLQGVLVTYEGVTPDTYPTTYQIQYSGDKRSIAVYYEPDVDLRIWLTDANGNEVNPEDVCEGSYRMNYALVDANGNPTSSKLLGDVKFSLPYMEGGVQKNHEDTKNGYLDLNLKKGDILDGNYQVTYLKDYIIPKTSAQLGWGNGITVKAAPIGSTTVEITGGADTYLLSQLEQNGVYQVKVYCDGQPVTGSDLDRVELTAEIQGSNVLLEQTRTEDGFTIALKYNENTANTQCGEATLALTAVYSNEDGKPGEPAYGTKKFRVEDDSQALKVELVLEQDYYVISDLETSAPIVAQLTIGGAPLTQEQFDGIKAVNVTIDGLQFDVQPDGANSRYLITLKNGENIATGDYTIGCHVDGVNGLGKPAQADASETIELQNYPMWMRILFWILVALLVIFVIWAYLNAKVLPKDIRIAPGGTFNVDGELIPGQILCTYTGKNKKRGNLRIQSPQCMSNPLARCGMTLELEAVSPRRTRSSARSVLVRGINPMNTSTTQNLQVGTRTLSKDPNTGDLIGVGIKPGAPITVRIGNNANAMIMAEVMDMNDGNTVSCTLTARLKFF